ncbi:MAG: endonuclease VIII [Planctomycetes bacterium]|nr:endonuclease VIII [Planctomycetota bacterium]
MPEGPEVARQADLIRAVTADQVAEVWFGLPRLKRFGKRLSGQRVAHVRARGKAFLLEFSGGLTIYAHLQLAGVWHVDPSGTPPETTRSLRVRIDTARGSAFLYSASTVEVLTPAGLADHSYLGKLGPDVLDPDLSEAALRERIASARFQRSSLGGLYLRQEFLAGLGNYLRTEILHQAKLHPNRLARTLDASERRRLAKATLALPLQSYRTGGITNQPRRAERLRKAGLPPRAARWLAFEREGEECYRCGARIWRETHNGRRLYLCRTCQPAP